MAVHDESGAYYGCEVRPMGPLQDMEQIDLIAGSGPHDRRAREQDFTGGLGPVMGEPGFGGAAEGTEAPKVRVP
jgi:hypothetical protein